MSAAINFNKGLALHKFRSGHAYSYQIPIKNSLLERSISFFESALSDFVKSPFILGVEIAVYICFQDLLTPANSTNFASCTKTVTQVNTFCSRPITRNHNLHIYMMKDALKKIFNSTKTITLYQYVPEENPGPKFTRLLPKEILRITEQRELISIRQYFDIHDTSQGSIRTTGYYFFEFESITGSKTSIMYLGHGRLRCDTIWQGDATLVRPLEFLHWLAKMGVTSPLESEIAAQKRRELEQEKAAKVRAKIPLSLCHPNGRLNLSNMRKDSTELFEEVKAKSSNTDALITDLFELLVLRSNN